MNIKIKKVAAGVMKARLVGFGNVFVCREDDGQWVLYFCDRRRDSLQPADEDEQRINRFLDEEDLSGDYDTADDAIWDLTRTWGARSSAWL